MGLSTEPDRTQLRVDFPSFWRATARRVRNMTLVWVLFGVASGLAIGWEKGGLIALAAGVVAGVVVLSVLGVLLGLVGGQWKQTLCGGSVGLIAGAVAAAVNGQSSVPVMAQQGMIFGGLVGATFLSLFSWIPRLLRLAAQSGV